MNIKMIIIYIRVLRILWCLYIASSTYNIGVLFILLGSLLHYKVSFTLLWLPFKLQGFLYITVVSFSITKYPLHRI